MALAGVKRAVGGDAGDPLGQADLVEQFRQRGRIADVAGGKFGRRDFQRLLINLDVDLAPDLPFGAPMLARVPFSFAFNLDAGAADEQVQGALRPAFADSRTMKSGEAAGVATLGAAGVEVAQSVLAETQTAILPLVPYLDTLRWMFIAVARCSITVTIYARLDDWRRGRR